MLGSWRESGRGRKLERERESDRVRKLEREWSC